jgi:16S rRNA (cytidine1402-2'-O)-methyltransferase
VSVLYVVATPIGNLEDITLRAIKVLREVDLIAAEDTRKTKRLLTAYQIDTRLTSFFEHNKQTKLPRLMNSLAEGDVALVSEAGMPGINDPGYNLIVAAVQQGIQVVPIPGPSAITSALAVSGITTESFVHLGFLPRKKTARTKLLQSLESDQRAIIAFESPHRLLASLRDAAEVFGERKIAVCREMTKMYEEIFRGTISQAIGHFTKPRGEFTLVIEGKPRK